VECRLAGEEMGIEMNFEGDIDFIDICGGI
jgi:hypothetical protein